MALLLLLILFVKVWPLGIEYYTYYRPATENWLAGESNLYDENARGYYYAPWSIALLVPTTWLPLVYGKALFNIMVMLCIVVAVHLTRAAPVPLWGVTLAIVSQPVFATLIDAQFDGIILFGLILTVYAAKEHRPWLVALGLWLISMKPNNVILPTLLILWSIRHWPRQDWLKLCSFTAGSFILSLPLFGFDWPLRYIENIRIQPLYGGEYNAWFFSPFIITIILFLFSIALWLRLIRIESASEATIALALVINLVFSGYVNTYHFVLLIPAFLPITVHLPIVAVLAWFLSFTPLIRPLNLSLIHMAYPMILLGFWLIWSLKRQQQVTPT